MTRRPTTLFDTFIQPIVNLLSKPQIHNSQAAEDTQKNRKCVSLEVLTHWRTQLMHDGSAKPVLLISHDCSELVQRGEKSMCAQVQSLSQCGACTGT